jgi:phage tail tube protein FII
MADQTFSKSVSDFRTMASGINTRADSLSGVGITAADAATMSAFADQLDAFNSEQEELKAKLKAKTQEISATMKQAKAKNSELTKRIKIAVPQQEWLAFGVTAKR